MVIRPRLTDYYDIPLTQEEVDFAIPFLDEDIPLYLDPFLLWKSPSQMDNGLHSSIIKSFNSIGQLFLKNEKDAINLLKELSECDEVGLGNSKTKEGKKIGDVLANSILLTFNSVPQVAKNGFEHIESLQLLVENFSKDRVSDIACNLIKSFLIDYTIQQSEKYGIPIQDVEIKFFEQKSLTIKKDLVKLPVNPLNDKPILLIPKRWLRFIPWINFDDFFSKYIETSQKMVNGQKIDRVEVLEYNRQNYDQVQLYISKKQLEHKDCKNDPLFSQIPILSSKRKKTEILKLPTGKTDNADKKYEDNLCPLLASMFYPELDFAQMQSRTISGVLIRDLIFYNNISFQFLKEIYEDFGSKQIVFELKNVKEVSSDHVDQLNRYLNNEFGFFGVIFTRNSPPKSVFKNTIDLWSGQRKCILILDDSDLELMCQLYEGKQRKPIEVINRKFREFMRACPS